MRGNCGERVFVPHEDIRIVDGATTYLHRDHLASVRLITDATSDPDLSKSYTPFGLETPVQLDAAITVESEGFIGERFDPEAGLQYLNARYYDPELGLFIQPDWFEVTKAGVGTNRYAYSNNDPINAMDPGGNEASEYVLPHNMVGSPEWRRSHQVSRAMQAALDNYPSSIEDGSFEAAFGTRDWGRMGDSHWYCDAGCDRTKRNSVMASIALIALAIDLANGPSPDVTLAMGTTRTLRPQSIYMGGKLFDRNVVRHFKDGEAAAHFAKHGQNVMSALNKSSYSIDDYVRDANHVVRTGTFVKELNGFIQLLGGHGRAKFAFSGIDRATGQITTFHIKSVSELIKKAPSLGFGK